MIIKKHNHHHFWIEDGILYETCTAIGGLCHSPIMKVEGFVDNNNCDNETIDLINKKYFEECKHEFVFREYLSQPYGTCAVCNSFVLN